MSVSDVFDLERFNLQMAEMRRLQEHEMEILGQMLRDLGIDPEQQEDPLGRRVER